MSRPELRLWQVLRTRPNGFKFRRQHPAGPYILDFYCAEKLLAVEVDGEAHDMGSNPARDEIRDKWLQQQGIRTIRCLASDVLADANEVVVRILAECARFD